MSLLIIDGHNYLWRSFSIPFKFYSPKGTPLHVITCFLKAIRSSTAKIMNVSHIVVVFDGNFIAPKAAIYENYKANRKRDFSEDEDSPFNHLENIQKSLDYLNIKHITAENCEADDLIGSIAKRFDGDVFIGSADTDFYQLINDSIKVLRPLKGGENDIVNAEYVKKKLSITPPQYVFHKSLTGDKSDNIPGIPKLGPIRATKIVNGELNFDLEPYKDILERNKALITITDTDPHINWDDLKYNKELLLSNMKIFNECGF